MNKSYTKKEREHLRLIKSLPCSVCDATQPSEAHHIRQDSAYYCIPLCVDCHRDIHGMKRIWKVMKLDQLDALALTMKAISEQKTKYIMP